MESNPRRHASAEATDDDLDNLYQQFVAYENRRAVHYAMLAMRVRQLDNPYLSADQFKPPSDQFQREPAQLQPPAAQFQSSSGPQRLEQTRRNQAYHPYQGPSQPASPRLPRTSARTENSGASEVNNQLYRTPMATPDVRALFASVLTAEPPEEGY